MPGANWMSKLILFVAIALSISACVVEPLPSDPYSLAQYGAGLQTQADTLLLSTDQAAVLEAHQLAMQATGTAAAWQIQATQTIASGQVQQTEQAQAIAGTAHIVQLAATEDAYRQTQTVEAVHYVATAWALEATTTAIGLAITHEKEMLDKRTKWVGIREAAYSLFIVFLLITAGVGMWSGIPWLAGWAVELRARKKPPIYETRELGPVRLYVDENGNQCAEVLRDTYYKRPRVNMSDSELDSIPAVAMSIGGVTAESALARSQSNHETLWLLNKCDPDSNKIAGHREAGINAEAWTRITDELVNKNLVNKVPGVGTFVIDGTCKDVLYKLETGLVQLDES